jgi:hypothetical protein
MKFPATPAALRRTHDSNRALRRALASGEDAGWTLREAAWQLEERFLWKGGDLARTALFRTRRLTRPVQRVVQTRLTWPLADVLADSSDWTKAAVAAGAATLAIAAGGAGIITATHQEAGPHHLASAKVADSFVSHPSVLQGVTPEFAPGKSAAASATTAPGTATTAATPTAPTASTPTTAATAKPDPAASQVASQFSQAFVAYEVGRSSKKTTSAFADTATKQLQQSLAKDPPRLPAKGKVPQAQVVNVVLADANPNQVTASVSLLRLKATSELRLTLVKAGKNWRVAQVLG